jgi:plasmid stabilization system protein ParE
MSRFHISLEAELDLDVIWKFIARNNIEAADRVQEEFNDTFAALARMPELGFRRTDLTRRPVRFFPLYSYLIIYEPAADPIQILAVVHGSRNVKQLLGE